MKRTRSKDVLSPFVFPVICIIYFLIGSLPPLGYRGAVSIGKVNLLRIWLIIILGLSVYILTIKIIVNKKVSFNQAVYKKERLNVSNLYFVSYFSILVGSLALLASYKSNGFVPLFAGDISTLRFEFKTPKYVGPLFALNEISCVLLIIQILSSSGSAVRKLHLFTLVLVNTFYVIAFGSRTGLLFELGLPLIFYHYRIRKVPAIKFILALLFGFFGFAALSFVRGLSVFGHIENYITFMYDHDLIYADNLLLTLLYATPRMTVETMDVFLRYIPQDVAPFMGRFMLSEISTLFPGYRINANALTVLFFNRVGLWATSGRPPSVFGISYADGLMFGVIIYMIFWGYVIGRLYRAVAKGGGILETLLYGYTLIFLLLSIYGMGVPSVQFLLESSVIITFLSFVLSDFKISLFYAGFYIFFGVAVSAGIISSILTLFL